MPRTSGRSRGAHTGPSPVDRARPGSKHHLIVDRHGTPLAVSLTSGNRHDVTQLTPLLDAIPPARGIRGRPHRRPRRLFADRGYDDDKYRRLIRAGGITPNIARKGTSHGSGLPRPDRPVRSISARLPMRVRTMLNVSFGIEPVVVENGVDRRVRRSRQLSWQALVGLILEKGYDRITVQDIIDRADIGRSTFYAHFTDKDDLLLSGLEEFGAAFEDNLNRHFATRGDPSPALPVFRHAHDNRDVYRALAGKRGGEVLREGLRRQVTEVMARHLGTVLPAGDPALPHDVTVEFVISSLLGLLAWWLDHDMPYTPEEMAAMYMSLTIQGVPAAYGI